MLGIPNFNNRSTRVNSNLTSLRFCVFLSAFLLTGCRGQTAALATPPPVSSVAVILPATSTPVEPRLPTPIVSTATANPGLPISPTGLPTQAPTPDAYAGYTIDALASRKYGGGELIVQETLDANSYFTRTLISYPSDGLAIYGFLNTPQERPNRPGPPYPVVIALHGYIDPAVYNTLDYTTPYADSLARAGFVVLHPNLRGYAPSEDGDNRFRVGMAVDVLNLISLVRQQAGKPGPLALADPENIGVWGHSMGGGITTRVITVDSGVKAAVLYGAMSGDDQKNYQRVYNYFSNQTRGLEELETPADAFLQISPVYFLDRIRSAVSIHHGENDVDVPPEWSTETCERLTELNKIVECYTYPDQPHTFQGNGSDLFMQRVIDFFNLYLRP